MKKNKKGGILPIILYVVAIGIIIFAIASLFSQNNEKRELVYSDLVGYFERNEVYGYVYNGEKDTITVTLHNAEGEAYQETYRFKDNEYYLFFGIQTGHEGDLKEAEDKVQASGATSNLTTREHISAKQIPAIVSYLPYIIMIILFIVFIVFSMRQTGGGKMGGFGKSKARTVPNDEKRVTFKDVAGADEEKEELMEVVEYLRNPAKFTALGAKIPHGVLLVGPPGTGKTLLAKAVAGEAGAPFFSMSGSDFVEMYVGVGASRVRDLFENARKTPSAIIFIDEIDAVGRQRGAGLGGGHDEREQTLNQLLVEMDGFDGHSGIIVIAATNRPDILDNALLRPGRFDRQITIGYPDIQGREDILKVHSKNKPFEENVDLHKIAQTTVGFTGADLANLLNEAALLAARRRKALIGMSEIEDAMIKITVGTQKKARRMSDKERKNTAAHEAGHAILSHVLPTQDPVRQISIIPSGRALGYTLTPPVEDKYSESKQEMKERIAMMLGGRVAEQLVFGDYTGGASNDIMRATEVARKMVTVYGMSEELGTIHFGSPHSSEAVFLGRDFNSGTNHSDSTAAKIDAEIKKIIDEAYKMAWDLLTKYRSKIDFITEFLLKYEIMDDEQFIASMKEDATMEELEALVAEKKRKSEEENQRRARELEERKKQLLEERARLERLLGLTNDPAPKSEENTQKTDTPSAKTQEIEQKSQENIDESSAKEEAQKADDSENKQESDSEGDRE